MACPAAQAADWPFERGDAASTGVAESTLPAEPQALWKYQPGESAFEATPVVAGGVAYLGDADGTFHAVRLSDGVAVWTRRFAEDGFLSAAAVEDGSVYVTDFDGAVRCLATTDGETRWAFETESEAYAGPIVHEGVLLVTTEGGVLHALDTATGEERWQFTIEAPLRCSPTIVNGHALLAGCDGKLHAIDTKSGEESGAVDIGGPTGCTAASIGGVASFGTESGEFYCVDAADPTAPAVRWTYRDPRRGQGIRSAAAATDGAIVYGSQAKAIYCLEPADGSERWTARLRSRVDSSPLILTKDGAGDRVVAATSRGRLMLLNLADGEVAWEYDAGGSFIASPVAVDGRLLIPNTDGVLYCFGQGEQGVAGSPQ